VLCVLARADFAYPMSFVFDGRSSLLKRNRSSVGGIGTTLRAGRPRNRGSIPGRGNIVAYTPKRRDRWWFPPVLQFTRYRERFARGLSDPRREDDLFYLMPWLRMSGAVPPFPYITSWRGQTQLYLCLVFP
jgi:hypothetical protein